MSDPEKLSPQKNIVNRDHLRELTVFVLLLAIGVVGRWYQLAWNVTPLAAVTVLGGYYFRQLLPAVLLPISILTVSNVLLPAYPHWQVQAAVYVMMLVPLALGRAARGTDGSQKNERPGNRWQGAKYFACCGLVPATLFYLVTNFAVWAFTPYYQKTLAGLANCYWMALPFYRWMLVGDLCFLTVLVGALMLSRSLSRQTMAARSI
jgi:hypothetical protein